MAIGILNPGDATNSTNSRPVGALSGVNQRRWFSGDLNTELKDQDLNAILGQLRHVIDYYGVTDVEGDDTLLRQAIASGATSLTGNVAALQGLIGVTDSVPYFTSPATMSSFIVSGYSRGLLAKTSIVQWQAELGIGAGSSPNVIALGGLAGGADTLPYFTGLGVMGQTGFTAAARTLLDDADIATMRTTLGLGTGATATIANYALIAGVNFTGTVTVAADPTVALGVATKQMVDLKAPLNAPAFTGIPTAPTAPPGVNTTQIATTAFVTTAVGAGGYAPLSSPVFTGVPSAPTAAPGTNTTQIATTQFVATSFAPLAGPTFTGVPAAPTASPGVSTTQLATTAFVTTADALKANVSNPAFTGAPTAPTATLGTNTTQLATTAYVVQGFAPLASPTLTGVPAVPTATGGTNTTQIASTAFVTAAVAASVVPYAPLASPALTGVPTAPTAAPGTNTTQIASTAFVTASNSGANTLTALLTVDGVGSLLDADLLDGQQGSFYQSASNLNAGTLAPARLSGAYITGITDLTITGGFTSAMVGTTINTMAVSSTGGTINFVMDAGVNKSAVVCWYRGGFPRWYFGKNATAESGGAGRTGSDLELTWYSDDASAFAVALTVRRSTGVFEFANSPTAPTPTAGDSSTKLATTAFVATATAGITGFAPLASPAFTGIPTAPTAVPGTNTTQLATTAYVQAFVGGGGYAPIDNPVHTGIVTAPQYVATTGTITTDKPALSITQTWNNAAVKFTTLKMNVVTTAVGAYSSLLDLQINGVTKVNIDQAGWLIVPGLAICAYPFGTPSIFIAPSNGYMYAYSTAGKVPWQINNLDTANSAVIMMASNLGIGWNSTADLSSGVIDTTLFRDAAGITAQRNLANAQTFRIYNTTDATNTNYERLSIGYAANVAKITHEAGGTGTPGRTIQLFAGANGILQLGANAGLQWQIPATGHLLPLTNNAFDVGAAATYARGVYTGALYVPGTATTSKIVMGNLADAVIAYNDGWFTFYSVGFGQAFSIYANGYGTANNEYMFISCYAVSPNPMTIRTSANGTGVFRPIQLQQWKFGPISPAGVGHITASSDNLFDIGDLAATGRPRTLYVGSSVNIASGTLTAASKPAIDISQTWNDAAVVFSAAKINVTNTAADNGSSLLDLQAAGVSKFAIDIGGYIYSPGFTFQSRPYGGNNTSLNYDAGSGYFWGYDTVGNGRWQLYTNGAVNTATVQIASDMGLGWNSGITLDAGTIDTTLFRDAANTLALRRLANAQTFRVYATTDATNTNFSRAALSADATRISLSAQKGGSGTDRALRIINETNGILELGTNNVVRWQIDASGHLMGTTDNSFDIGAAAATRPRSIFVGSSITAGTGMGIGTAMTSSSFATIAAGTTAKSPMRLLTGVAPTTPVNGDIWFDGTLLKMQVGGVTKTVTMT